MHDRYSSGPFSRVYFMHTCYGLDTFTNRKHRIQPTGTMIYTITTIDDTRAFRDVFVSTSAIKTHDQASTHVVQRP